jgi:hypothetical protein
MSFSSPVRKLEVGRRTVVLLLVPAIAIIPCLDAVPLSTQAAPAQQHFLDRLSLPLSNVRITSFAMIPRTSASLTRMGTCPRPQASAPMKSFARIALLASTFKRKFTKTWRIIFLPILEGGAITTALETRKPTRISIIAACQISWSFSLATGKHFAPRLTGAIICRVIL